VKVLDFGLAKLTGPPEGGPYAHPDGRSVRLQPDVTASPTITAPGGTALGVILGTAGYMSPEQAKGRPADKRSDVWAFGCVLYEMLTGRRAFEGEDISDTLAAVLRAEPDWSALPVDTPTSIRTLLQGCLAKDRRQRIADISTALFVLSHRQKLDAAGAVSAATTPLATPVWRRLVPAISGIIAAVAAGYAAFTVWTLKPEASGPLTRFTITLPGDEEFTSTGRHLVAISPDGRRIVYVASNRLYFRRLDQLDAVPIPRTEGTGLASPRSPFFAFDGQWIGFWADGRLKKVSVNGGAPTTNPPE
jgi:serine/threonine-protein kinase